MKKKIYEMTFTDSRGVITKETAFSKTECLSTINDAIKGDEVEINIKISEP